jgi:hypothetical protein
MVQRKAADQNVELNHFGVVEIREPRSTMRPMKKGAGSKTSPFEISRYSPKSSSRFNVSHLCDFEEPRCAHAAADTHGDHNIFRTPALTFNQGVPGHPITGHAKGMTNRNCSAVYI